MNQIIKSVVSEANFMKEFNKSGKSRVYLLSRREILLLAGGATIASLFESRKVRSSAVESRNIGGCLVSPEQTAGPYFVDERLERQDIRSDPKDRSVKAGVLLNLELSVFQVAQTQCKPLKNALVDIWHCDAAGIYSDVNDFNADTRGQKFLRGYQTTDDDGNVKFTTIYPGWYSGRTVHIHYKIRTDANSGRGFEHTSQLYFEDSITDEVHKQKPYSQRGKPNVTNKRDYIFQGGGDKLMLELSKKEDGYVGKYSIGFILE